jgi:hypothetical protein
MKVILSERVSTIAILHGFVSIGSVDTNMTDCHQQGRSVFGFWCDIIKGTAHWDGVF